MVQKNVLTMILQQVCCADDDTFLPLNYFGNLLDWLMVKVADQHVLEQRENLAMVLKWVTIDFLPTLIFL